MRNPGGITAHHCRQDVSDVDICINVFGCGDGLYGELDSGQGNPGRDGRKSKMYVLVALLLRLCDGLDGAS